MSVAALAASASFSKPNTAAYLRLTTCAITKLMLIPALGTNREDGSQARGSRALSRRRRITSAAGRFRSRSGCGDLLSQVNRSLAAAIRKDVRVARDNEPRASARKAGTPRGSARDARRNPRLVHRRLRYRRSEKRQGVARRTERVDGGGIGTGRARVGP